MRKTKIKDVLLKTGAEENESKNNKHRNLCATL